jgi:RimJ/RimL family protein N-acetyltransferase
MRTVPLAPHGVSGTVLSSSARLLFGEVSRDGCRKRLLTHEVVPAFTIENRETIAQERRLCVAAYRRSFPLDRLRDRTVSRQSECDNRSMTSLTIRRASELDSRDLFEWRNDPHTRAVSLSTNEVTWEDHERWFSATLAIPARHIFICQAILVGAEESIGMVRFDLDEAGASAEVSINLNPSARGRGFGSPALTAGIEAFLIDEPDVRQLTAQIRDSNVASVAIFTKVGFVLSKSDGGVGHYVRVS